MAERRRGSIILGIDPGSRRTGFALLEQQGRTLSVLRSGCIRLSPSLELAARLGKLARELDAILDELLPDAVAVEDVFSHKNARSALALGQARGAVLAAVGRRELPVAAYPPSSVKQAVAGNGRADKGQIQRMVQVLLSLDSVPQEDEADAMAIAICHGLRARSASLTASSPPPRRRAAPRPVTPTSRKSSS